jgi:hypothetical protein
MFLASLVNASKGSTEARETVERLAGDRECIVGASEIIATRLAGWYEERHIGQQRSMPMYYPLLHLLSVSQHKIASMALLTALPAAGFDAFFRESLFSNKRALAVALSKLPTIENQLCCAFPGRALVSEMQAIDFRLSMLTMYLEAARDSGARFASGDAEMKRYVVGCLGFGDGSVGRVIRELAVELACILIGSGQRDLLPAVEKIAVSDPCFLYHEPPPAQNRLQQYDAASGYYPVREKAGSELLRLKR